MISDDIKPDLVLLHGFVQNKRLFDRQIAHFGDRYRVHALDLRGHGRSQNEPGPYGNEEYTDDIQAYFDTQGLRNAIVWGTHTGTGVAINLYLRQPDYIGRMILEGLVIPGSPTPEIDANIQRTKNVARAQGLDAAHTDWIEASGWYRYLNAHPEKARKAEQLAIIRDFAGRPWLNELPPQKPRDMRGELGRIACPCLAYNGEHDMTSFLSMSEAFAKATGSRREIVPESGGFPLWENPEYVNHLVEAWLGQR
ncbi:MAG: alpha/beta hydrolase [Uliginosibacterium sp.]|nr:alpha/beta hydrolase [Uliginosibacterium sp.]